MLVLVAGLSACRHKDKGTKVPGDTQWAKRLDAQLAKRPNDPIARRDAALLASAFLPDTRPEPRYQALKQAGIQDPLGAYALGVRAMRRHDPQDLLLAAQVLLAAERKSLAPAATDMAAKAKASTRPSQAQVSAQLASPWHTGLATAQVLGWLWQEMQDLPELHHEIETLWSEYGSAPLGRKSKRALLSLIGKSRRLAGKPYAFAHQQQGCVQRFSTTAIQGTLGDLSLTRANLEGPWNNGAGQGAPLFPLACALRVWNPTQDAGFVGLQSDITLTKADMVLNVGTPAAARVWLDGQEIWRNDGLDRFSARDKAFLIHASPGVHRLKIALSIPGDKEWLLVRATDLQGNPLATQAASGSEPAAKGALLVQDLSQGVTQRCRAQLQATPAIDPLLAEPWVTHCALASALEDYDREASDTRTAPLETFEGFAEGVALLADADLQNKELPASLGKSAASQKLAAAVALDADLLGLALALAQNRSNRGQADEVREELAAMKPPRHVDDALFRFGVYLDIGDELRADQVLALAQKLNPGHCEVVAASFRRARDLDARARQAELLPKLERCPGYRTLALRFWTQRGRDDKAKPLLDSLLKDRPDDIDKLSQRARLHQRQGHWNLAQADLDRVLALQPASFSSHLRMADQARANRDQASAKALLERLRVRYPNENYLYRYLEDLGTPDPLVQDRVDGEKLVASYQKDQAQSSPFAQDASVFILDRDFAHAYDNGSQRHLIHQIIRVQSKEAIDTYGEITIPDNAELLTLRTIKQDGRVIEPEKTPGKSSFSMRALEIGDYVEQEFILPAQWAQAQKGAADLGVFRFASTQAPFVRSELIVQAPPGLHLQIEARNGAPTPTISEHEGQRRWSFLATNQARIVPEPSTPSPQDLIPQVRCFANLSAAQWLDELVATTMNTRRRGPWLRKKVRSWTQGKKSPASKLRAIYNQVNRTIEAQGDLGDDVNRTLSSGKGSRSNLMYALLKEAKIPVQMLLVRSRFASKLDPQQGHPQFDSFETAVLEVWPDDPKRRRYLIPDLPFAPIGYVPEWLEGGLAHVLPEPSQRTKKKPRSLGKGLASLADRRELDLDLTLDPQGNAKVKGRLSLYGFYAAQWRQALKQAGAENQEDLFSQYELPRYLPGKSPRIEQLKIRHQKDPQKALRMDFELNAQRVGILSGSSMELSADLVHLNPGAALVGLAQRKLDLLIASAGVSRAKISLHLPAGLTWSPSLQASLKRDLVSAFGSFRLRPSQSGSTLTMEIESKLRPQVVSPSEYPKLVHFVQEVHRAQAQRMTANRSVQAR